MSAAGGGADVHVERGAVGGVPGHAGDVGGVELPAEECGGAEHVPQAVPGPRAVAVGVAPADGEVSGLEDVAAEVGGPPVPAGRGGEDQAEGVGAGGLLGARLLCAGGEPLGQRVAGRGADRVDRLAVLAVLRRLDVQVPGDIDDLAVDSDDAGGRVELGGGQGGQLAPAQAAVGGGGECGSPSRSEYLWCLR
jgi:hypothetical protein